MSLSQPQRVSLIKEIATRLVVESYSPIDLTPKEFALPISDSWNGQPASCILAMVEKAKDQTPPELAQHLGFTLEAPASSHIEKCPSLTGRSLTVTFSKS
jgi:hypothetical protein